MISCACMQRPSYCLLKKKCSYSMRTINREPNAQHEHNITNANGGKHSEPNADVYEVHMMYTVVCGRTVCQTSIFFRFVPNSSLACYGLVIFAFSYVDFNLKRASNKNVCIRFYRSHRLAFVYTVWVLTSLLALFFTYKTYMCNCAFEAFVCLFVFCIL